VAETGEERLARDAVVGGGNEWVGHVDPAVAGGMTVEVDPGPFESLAPVVVGFGQDAIGVGRAAEGLVGVGEEVREVVEREDNGKHQKNRDGGAAEGGSPGERSRRGTGENDAERMDGKQMAHAEVEHGGDGKQKEEDRRQDEED
jgi:hypothetical protein